MVFFKVEAWGTCGGIAGSKFASVNLSLIPYPYISIFLGYLFLCLSVICPLIEKRT